MNVLATVLGLLAVAMFVGSYQLKSGRAIIFFNAGSRVLYVIQYISSRRTLLACLQYAECGLRLGFR